MTRLDISDRRLHAAVHRVFDRVPDAARARLAGEVELITDRPHPLTKSETLGVCERYSDGRQHIYLSPALASKRWEQIELVVAHELAHALQPSFSTPDNDEPFAQYHASAWGFDPSDKYPKIDWKR